MAITTLDGLIAGLQPPTQFYKQTGTMEIAGVAHSLWLAAGNPGPAAAPAAGLAGEALTGTVAGSLRFPATVAGKNIHAARFEAVQSANLGSISICDRLWQNSGFVVTSTGAQTINSVTLPARDINGATSGEGVWLALEQITVGGAGTPTFTVSYTNSAGTGGRTGTIGPVATTLQAGTFYPMNMQSGDTGVRSVQTITSSATMTSGTVSFVMYREIVAMPTPGANYGIDRDAVALGLPRAYDASVLFLLGMATATTNTIVDGAVAWAQG